MAKMKCKYCNEELLKTDKYVIKETGRNGKEKSINVHIACADLYRELMEYKRVENKWFADIYEHIKELLEYTVEQRLPNSLITRIRDLRNGTIMQKGIGRVVKCNEGYNYQAIYDTFLSCGDSIRWSFENKQFNSEASKINYMMAIVESKINDNYISFKNRLDKDVVKQRDNIIEEEKSIENNISAIKTESMNYKNSGISKFLEEEDF